MRKGGSTNFIFVKQGEVNNLTVEMIPIDGKLSLILDNINAQFDTIFVGVYSPILDSETGFSDWVSGSPNLPIYICNVLTGCDWKL